MSFEDFLHSREESVWSVQGLHIAKQPSKGDFFFDVLCARLIHFGLCRIFCPMRLCLMCTTNASCRYLAGSRLSAEVISADFPENREFELLESLKRF